MHLATAHRRRKSTLFFVTNTRMDVNREFYLGKVYGTLHYKLKEGICENSRRLGRIYTEKTDKIQRREIWGKGRKRDPSDVYTARSQWRKKGRSQERQILPVHSFTADCVSILLHWKELD